MPFLDGLPAPATDERRLVAHPRDAVPLEDGAADGRARTVVAIGPEGGWIDRELASLEGLGFQRVQLGEAVLRVETAVTSILSQLALLRRLGARR